jgi:hypothetical protein
VKDQEHRMTDETTPQDGKAMSPASAGSQLREQIAALVHDAMRFDREAKTPKWQGGNSYAESRARQAAWQIATLSQPTLTDEEREAISAAACICEDAGRTDISIIVNTALSRLG